AGRYPLVSAASIVRDSIRGLIIGNRGSGRTTLVLRLMLEGFYVECEECVLVREQNVLALPRALRVKQETLRLLGPPASIVAASPSCEDWYGRRIYSVKPSNGGQPWLIEAGPTSLLIFIEPNHGGTSILTNMGREEAFARLLETSHFPKEARGAAAAVL